MIGLVVNPVAGVGGPAGLAGSDGADVQRLALARGARSRVQERAVIALTTLAERHPGLVVATVAGRMGADAVRAAGLVPRVLCSPPAALPAVLPAAPPAALPAVLPAALPAVLPAVQASPSARLGAERTAYSREEHVRSAGSRALGGEAEAQPEADADADADARTDAGDTSRAVAALVAAGVDLILVVGGDGTLRDAVAGLGAADPACMPEPGAQLPAVLGIPAGVKMYSPVFAVSPRAAGAIAADWVDRGGLPTDDREVLDIDEVAMRRARVEPTLYGMLRVPYRAGRTQARKAPTPATEAAAVDAAARGAVARMRPGVRYLLGPGGTTAEIARRLGVEGSPLGVDVVLDGAVIVRGASEHELLAEVARGPAQAVITVIGGQGFLLGRGNQQLSAAVVRALGHDPLLVVAPEQKLIDLHGRPLLVDTGDPELDARLAGHVRIVTGVGTSSLYPVTAPELIPDPSLV
ncbi:ATP-NAD kinase family protein [Microbacterium sp. K22]|uniref:ATP-NAD kinase family protein n=2 Tax=unclassified Microbacterium TaxID=2609290 RepID=UPI00109C03D5|nr:NAD(+)/NADH kinase [Microbacterium sp. K22]